MTLCWAQARLGVPRGWRRRALTPGSPAPGLCRLGGGGGGVDSGTEGAMAQTETLAHRTRGSKFPAVWTPGCVCSPVGDRRGSGKRWGREAGSGRGDRGVEVRGALDLERWASGRANEGLFPTPGAPDLTPGPQGWEGPRQRPGWVSPAEVSQSNPVLAPGRCSLLAPAPGVLTVLVPCLLPRVPSAPGFSGHFPGRRPASLSLHVFARVCPLVKVCSCLLSSF